MLEKSLFICSKCQPPGERRVAKRNAINGKTSSRGQRCARKLTSSPNTLIVNDFDILHASTSPVRAGGRSISRGRGGPQSDASFIGEDTFLSPAQARWLRFHSGVTKFGSLVTFPIRYTRLRLAIDDLRHCSGFQLRAGRHGTPHFFKKILAFYHHHCQQPAKASLVKDSRLTLSLIFTVRSLSAAMHGNT
jgi:hypothetical protein